MHQISRTATALRYNFVKNMRELGLIVLGCIAFCMGLFGVLYVGCWIPAMLAVNVGWWAAGVLYLGYITLACVGKSVYDTITENS